MKTLSIKQPWAYAILHLGKDVENRTWKTKFTGELLIHAGKSYDKKGAEFLKSQGFKVPADLPMGGIVGSVTVISCTESSESNWWNEECFAWNLKSPMVREFIPYKGQLGLFNVTTPGEVS